MNSFYSLLQCSNCLFDVIVDNGEVKEMTIGLPKKIRFFCQALKAPIILKCIITSVKTDFCIKDTNKGKGKWKLLPGIEEITKGTGTHKHMETVSRYFDWHGHLSQLEESKCLWTHDKNGVTREFTKGATRKTSVIFKMSQLSCVFVCAFRLEICSFFR